MAQKRMFSLQVVDTDKFYDMSSSAQALYFHLGMHGDDDGFVASPRKIIRAAGCSDDDLRLLAAKGYIIPFDSGVVVITDWLINNTLKNDRYHETRYLHEKSELSIDPTGRYCNGSRMEPIWNQFGTGMEPEHNLTEHNTTKPNKSAAKPQTHSKFEVPKIDDIKYYCESRNNSVDPLRFFDYYSSNGWMVGRNKMKDWKAAVRNWERHDVAQKSSVSKQKDYNAGSEDFL